MAKPIRATPELTGRDANRFLGRLVRMNKAKVTKKDAQLAEELLKFEW
jgi:hypothetical protein